ncbi:adenylyltransferase/cytidyltransferase family protein [Flavobacteriaceae bacterium]|nr:adenylyltransferase/cytidyltransferase family protein [Flavobacteriaceae bacterium]
MSKQKAIIVSGYFNPIHKGHLEYFNNAKAIADKLFVIVNSNHQRALKGSKEFQDENELELGFANGGDQNNDTIPEREVCEKNSVALIDGLGDKIQSSSWLLKKL